MKVKHAQEEQNARQLIKNLQEKLEMQAAHHTQLQEYFSAAKQETNKELSELKTQLNAAHSQKDELLAKLNEHAGEVQLCKTELGKKDEIISNLRNDIKQLIHEFKAETAELNRRLCEQGKTINERKEEIEALKKALTNQEAFTDTVSKENTILQEKAALLEEQHHVLENTVKDLQRSLGDAQGKCNTFKMELEQLMSKKDELEDIVQKRDQKISDNENELEKLKENVSKLEAEKNELISELDQITADSNAKTATIDLMKSAAREMEDRLLECTHNLIAMKESKNQIQIDLGNVITGKNKEIEDKVKMVNQLMLDVKNENDAKNKLEAILLKLQQDTAMERETWKEKEKKLIKQVEQFEIVVKDKDIEFSKQISIIKELRAEKERQQLEIQNLQSTIDNVQKELTGRKQTKETVIEPEQDDNAVMFPPIPKPKLGPQPSKPQLELGKIYEGPNQLDYVFKFFSDSESSLDQPLKVPNQATKRRGGVPVAQGGPKKKYLGKEGESSICLSDIRNELNKKSFFKGRPEKKPKK